MSHSKYIVNQIANHKIHVTKLNKHFFFFGFQNSSKSKSILEQSKDLLLKANQQIAFFFAVSDTKLSVKKKKINKITALKK